MKFLPKKRSKKDSQTNSKAPRRAYSSGDDRSSQHRRSTTMYYRPSSTAPKTSLPSQKNTRPAINIPSIHVKDTYTNRLPAFVMVVVFSVLLFFASTLSGDVVVKIAADQYVYRDANEYQQTASELVDSSGIAKSKLLFRSDQYEQRILSAFPEIDRASALLPLGGRDLTLQLKTSQPLVKIQSTDAKAKIVNTTGALIVLDTHTADTQKLPLVVLDASYATSLEQGDQVLTSSEVDLLSLVLQEFNTSLPKVGSDGIERITLSIADGQVLVYLKSVPYYVKLSSYNPIKEQVGAAKASLIDLTLDGQPPLEYLDARVPGRVYVR